MSEADKLTRATERFAELATDKGVPAEPERTRIVVDKSRRLLRLFCDEQLLVEIPVIIGRSPIGHKQAEGDERTPEGDYRICYLNAESRFHLFLGLNYPNVSDARIAHDDGRLDEATYEALVAADNAGDVPDWYTPLGGEVGIHGGGIGRDGTAGCVAMADDDIELVWGATSVGTSVRIIA